jgi:hypothetical protein
MKKHLYPVRANTPQRFEYTFRDQANAVIDISDYDNCYLMVKRQGDAYDPADWMIVAEKDVGTPGKVFYDGFAFGDGEWVAQFKVQLGTGEAIYGEPLRLKVVLNIEDLAPDDLPEY